MCDLMIVILTFALESPCHLYRGLTVFFRIWLNLLLLPVCEYRIFDGEYR